MALAGASPGRIFGHLYHHCPKVPKGSRLNLPALAPQHPENGLISNFSESHNDAQMVKQAKLGFQKRSAVAQFFRAGSVVRGRTARRRADEDSTKPESILSSGGIGLIRQTYPAERGKKEPTGVVAREHSAGSVGAVRPGGQPNHPEPGRPVSEAGHGLSPVFLCLIPPDLPSGNLATICSQSRASMASHDLALQDIPLFNHSVHHHATISFSL